MCLPPAHGAGGRSRPLGRRAAAHERAQLAVRILGRRFGTVHLGRVSARERVRVRVGAQVRVKVRVRVRVRGRVRVREG